MVTEPGNGRSARERRLVIGLGSGRSGTVSLARLLDAQPGCAVTHEVLEYNLRAEGSGRLVRSFLAELLAGSPMRPGAHVVGDVFSAYLYYVDQIAADFPGTRFICLRRDRASTIESFARKVAPAHHWIEHDGVEWMSDPWDASFPNFPGADTIEDAIGLYWDDYYARSETFERSLPGVFKIFDLDTLNSQAGQAELLEFARLDAPTEQLDVWKNRGEHR